MHESAAARAIVDLAVEKARALGARRVATMIVQVGELSGTDPEFIEHAIEEMAQGTPAQGARVEIEPVAGTILCRTCSRKGGVEERLAMCPACGSTDVEILGGIDLRLCGIEVETE